jgi:hypothetical protein
MLDKPIIIKWSILLYESWGGISFSSLKPLTKNIMESEFDS